MAGNFSLSASSFLSAIAFSICLRYNSVKRSGGIATKALTYIEAGKIDTTPLITHRYKLETIEEAYLVFGNKLDGVIKVAVKP